MSFFKLTDQYHLGIKDIDKQHESLVAMVNKLFDAMSEGKANNILGAIINDMANYARVHFDTEEHYFDEFNYEHTEEHIAEHKKFIEEIAVFKADFHKGNIVLSMEVFKFLKNWLLTHIQDSDQKYLTCFRNNGL